MSVSFVTPAGALVALAGLVPLAVLGGGRQRLRALCGALGLRPPSKRGMVPTIVALVVLVALLALAAAQPVAARRTTTKGRADVEAFFVFDVSRSMAARLAPGSPTRLARAKADGKRLRAALPDVPVGIASLTDRLLPHLFPSVSLNAFDATLDGSLGIDRPTSSFPYGNVNATKVGALDDLINGGYFAESAKKRVVVLFTDGETRTDDLSSLPPLARDAHIKFFFFRYWRPQERIYVNGRINTAYAPDPTAQSILPTLARLLGTRVYGPGQTAQAAAAVRAAIGKGRMTTRGRDLDSVLLTPYVLLFALVPLLFLLARTEGMWPSGRAGRRWSLRRAS